MSFASISFCVPEEPIFSPAKSEAARKAARRAARVTPDNQGNRPGYTARTRNGETGRQRAPKGGYTVDSYRRAIERACDKAFSPPA